MRLNKKNKLLFVGFLISLCICYIYAFSNTIFYYSKYKTNEKVAELVRNNSSELTQLRLKERHLDNILKENNFVIGKSFQNELLKQFTLLSSNYGIKIIEFKEPHIYKDENEKIYSYFITLEGGFNSMLKFINDMENNTSSLVNVKSVSFIKYRNYKTNTDYLNCKIVLQRKENLEKIN